MMDNEFQVSRRVLVSVNRRLLCNLCFFFFSTCVLTWVPVVLKVAAGASASVVVESAVVVLADVRHWVSHIEGLVVAGDASVPTILLAKHHLMHARGQLPVTDLQE